jgi:hypothetical protein
MTIEQPIEIPADRHLRLDLTLPESFPAGQGEIILLDSTAKAQKTFKAMSTIAELKKEAEERAELEWATDDNPLEKSFGSLKRRPLFWRQGRHGNPAGVAQ